MTQLQMGMEAAWRPFGAGCIQGKGRSETRVPNNTNILDAFNSPGRATSTIHRQDESSSRFHGGAFDYDCRSDRVALKPPVDHFDSFKPQTLW
jgi:hypothetical protein